METVIRIPTLHTERLTMRTPRMDDFDVYADFCASDRAVGIGGPYPRSLAFARFGELIGHWHLRGYGRWLVADRETDAPLGVVGLMYPDGWPEPEIAWTLFEAAEGRGVATEAALETRRYAYEDLGWKRVISCTLPNNHRSITLAQRMGAVHEDDFTHPTLGQLLVWRHLEPEAV